MVAVRKGDALKLPKGYKQTEVGVIPNDWTFNKIGNITNVSAGGTPSTLMDYYWGGVIPWMNSGELNLKHVRNVENRITEEGLKNSSTKYVPKFSVLIGLAGQGKTRGTAAINYFALCTNQSIAAIYPSDEHNSFFLYYYLDCQYNELRKLSTGDGGRGGLNLTIIKNIQIPLPTLTEQKAIATALSDVDELISKLDTLIAKKQAIKQGTMQQLLTGKKRLPGFDGKWEEKRLGDCLTYEQPTKYIVKSSEYEGQSQIPVLTAGKTFLLGYTDESSGIYNKLPVIIFDDFTTSSQFVDFKFKVKSSAMKLLQPVSANISIYFIYLTMKLIRFSLGDEHKRRWIAEYSNIKIKVPEFDEQLKISELISDMDKEIEALQSKKSKYSRIKEGMMQELLTGKTRLI